MTTHHLLPIALAGIAGTLGGVSVALTQPTPPTVKPPIAELTQSKPSDPPMTFFVATEEASACGSGCNRWIAADGRIDLAAAQRLRKLLANLDLRRRAAGHAAVAAIVEPGAGHKLPILLHSGGGSVLGAIELGRLIRSRKIEVSVAHTIPAGCSRDRLHDKSCEMLKRSGQDLVSELDSGGAMCNSACVLALSGGAVRSVPPWVRLGVHAVGIDLAKTEIRGPAAAAATHAVNSRIVEFLRDM